MSPTTCSTPVSRQKLDLERYRRLRQPRGRGTPTDTSTKTSSTKTTSTATPPTASPPTSNPQHQHRRSRSTPKATMTWQQLEATLTPHEKQALFRSRRQSSSTSIMSNENRPGNLATETTNSSSSKSLSSGTEEKSSMRTPTTASRRPSSSTPTPRRAPRVVDKGHLLGRRGRSSSTERASLTPTRKDATPRSLSTRRRSITPTSTSAATPPPTTTTTTTTTAPRSTTKRGRTARTCMPFSSPPLAPRSDSASLTTSPVPCTPRSSTRINETPSTPASMDRSREFSVGLRRTASVERWHSASRLYARATTSPSPHKYKRSSSQSRDRDATPPPMDTTPRTCSATNRASARKGATNHMDDSSPASRSSAARTPTTTPFQQQQQQDSHPKVSNTTPHSDQRHRRRRSTLTPPPRAVTTPPTAKSGTRRNLDKRSARFKYSSIFALDIAKRRQQSALSRPVHDSKRNVLEDELGKGVSVVVRKRPIFEYELQQGDFDVVFTEARNDHEDAVVVYSTMMHADMRQMLVKPHAFACSAALDEDCGNDDLCRLVGQPLVERVVQGGMATLLMFGATGTGKTHTMTGMEEHVATNLFELLPVYGEDECHVVSVQFVELSGKLCRDLLEEGSVRVAEHEDGSAKLLNAACLQVTSAQELYNVICHGKRQRATEATGRNGVSSRSHAVCQITVTSRCHRPRETTTCRGVLTLLDCAGTERRNDSIHHTRERQKESAEINASLWALKECIRARAAGDKGKRSHVPYRSSNLTRILRETLERDDALLCVVATVAPNATDTEHTLETLRTVSTLVGMDGALEEGKAQVVSKSPPNTGEEPQTLTTPKQWSHAQLVDFVLSQDLLINDIPAHMDGRFVMRLSTVQIKNLLYDKDHADMAETLFQSLRAENDRISRILIQRRLMGT